MSVASERVDDLYGGWHRMQVRSLTFSDLGGPVGGVEVFPLEVRTFTDSCCDTWKERNA